MGFFGEIVKSVKGIAIGKAYEIGQEASYNTLCNSEPQDENDLVEFLSEHLKHNGIDQPYDEFDYIWISSAKRFVSVHGLNKYKFSDILEDYGYKQVH